MRKRSNMRIMWKLIALVKSMWKVMTLAIVLGSLGHMCAIFITIIGGFTLLTALGVNTGLSMTNGFILLAILSVARGALRYGEQASNHYIAFKVLANVRCIVFDHLRTLAPAKLDGKNKGDLIALMTSDVELLEVFYAHTISPVCIAMITSVVMCIFFMQWHFIIALIAACFYTIMGVIIPLYNGKKGAQSGSAYRKDMAALNTFVLDSLYGADTILQYQQETNRLTALKDKTNQLEASARVLLNNEVKQRNSSDMVILLAGLSMVLVSVYLYQQGQISFTACLIATIAMLSSFGPTIALSSLSNTLNHTLASGDRVLSLLEEKPVVEEVQNDIICPRGTIRNKDLSFQYDTKQVLHHFQATFEKGKMYGLHGKSGCGKSTLLKLLMHFYEPQQGTIQYDDTALNVINSDALRMEIAYVSQDTFLFEDTIFNNIKLVAPNASEAAIIEAAKQAAIHDDILELDNGYETIVGENGNTLSSGQRQRLALARAFLHDGQYIFLDEPTSNIDSLNEGIILRSIMQHRKEKTILLVSHKKETLHICDEILSM